MSKELVRRLDLLDTERMWVTSMTYFGTHLTIGVINFLQAPLAPEEITYVTDMSDKRRLEFVAGRTAAKISMSRAGHPKGVILRQQGGAPIWPKGLFGSLTHNNRLAAAAVIDANRSTSIGIDIEENVALPDDVLGLVLTPAERSECTRHGSGASVRAKLLFSAKEAVFKADWPRYGEFLDFADIQLFDKSEDVLIGFVKSASERRDYIVQVARSEQTIITLSRMTLGNEGV